MHSSFFGIGAKMFMTRFLSAFIDYKFDIIADMVSAR